jgi:hypothetical protein
MDNITNPLIQFIGILAKRGIEQPPRTSNIIDELSLFELVEIYKEWIDSGKTLPISEDFETIFKNTAKIMNL